MITTLNWCPECKIHLPDGWTHCKKDHRAVLQEFSCAPVEAVEHGVQNEAVNYLQLRLIMLNNDSGVRWSLKDRAAVSALCISASKVNEVYEKHKHLDRVLSDPQFVEGSAMAAVARDLWLAIKP